MRSKKTNRRESQTLNTSSLPDIVFMILFFFMAIGMFPPPQAKIENDIIVSTAGSELEDTSNYIHLRISGDQIQLGYEIIDFEQLTEELTLIKDRDVVILYIDDDTPIGFIKNHIEKAILEAGKRKISHQVLEEKPEVSS